MKKERLDNSMNNSRRKLFKKYLVTICEDHYALFSFIYTLNSPALPFSCIKRKPGPEYL